MGAVFSVLEQLIGVSNGQARWQKGQRNTGLNLNSATSFLCDVRQVSRPLCASVSHCVSMAKFPRETDVC